MSEEYAFQDLSHFNWNDSVSLKSQKNIVFTTSNISKSEHNNQLCIEEFQNDWNVQEFNKKNQRKLKNRINAKNFRQKKKDQTDKFNKKLKYLEAQNKILKMEKFCRYCKKPYGGMIQISQVQNEAKKELRKENQFQAGGKQGKQSFEFQKPIFYTKNQKQGNNRNGKIWIALGILMMVIGVHLYGFRGKEGYQDISISKIQSKKWIDVYQNKADNLDQYFNVKLKLKAKENLKQKQKEKQIFKQIRIFHEQQGQEKDKQYNDITKNTIQKLDMIQQNNELNIKSLDFENVDGETQVKFHKEMLYAIQAEIDDLGNYL